MANQDDLSKLGDAGWELVEASPGLGAQMKPACLHKGPLCFSSFEKQRGGQASKTKRV